MINLVRNELKNFDINSSSNIIVAVSGGIDSVCLVDVLYKLGYNIILAHVNHKKRTQSEIEEQYLVSYAHEMSIKIEVMHLDHNDKCNFHDYAHHKRHEFFYSLVKKYQACGIFLAHHLDDHLESIIMKFMKGSNLYGYAGLKKITPYLDTFIYRPFLCLKKNDIIDYQKANHITYFEDESNDCDDYLRNQIRHHILPEMTKYEIIYEKSKQFRETLLPYFELVRNKSINYIKESNNKIDINYFQALEIVEQKDLLASLLESNKITISNNKIDELIKIIQSNKPNIKQILNNQYNLIKSYNQFYIEKSNHIVFPQIQIDNPENHIIYQNKRISFNKFAQLLTTNCIKICYNINKFPFTVRTRENGDLLEMSYGFKKLKDLLIDKKIPKDKRDALIVIANADNKIIYVESVYEYRANGDADLYLIVEEISYEK